MKETEKRKGEKFEKLAAEIEHQSRDKRRVGKRGTEHESKSVPNRKKHYHNLRMKQSVEAISKFDGTTIM